MATIAVDPTNIPKRLTRSKLEAWILFGILVANKEADQTRKKLDQLFTNMQAELQDWSLTAFELVNAIDEKPGALLRHLKEARTGQYTRIEKAFRQVAKLDADTKTLTVEALEACHGIGPKTARMIVLYAGPETSVVPLDTHVLKYLRKLGYDCPKATPPAGPKYRYWESVFVSEAKKAGMSVRDFDTYVWKMYAKSTQPTRG